MYYLTVTVPGNYIPSAQYTLATSEMSLTTAEQILTSEEGGTVKFVREGDKISTYISDMLVDTYTLPPSVLKGKGYFVELGAAKGAVGISSFGGEAEVKNVIFTRK